MDVLSQDTLFPLMLFIAALAGFSMLVFLRLLTNNITHEIERHDLVRKAKQMRVDYLRDLRRDDDA